MIIICYEHLRCMSTKDLARRPLERQPCFSAELAVSHSVLFYLAGCFNRRSASWLNKRGSMRYSTPLVRSSFAHAVDGAPSVRGGGDGIEAAASASALPKPDSRPSFTAMSAPIHPSSEVALCQQPALTVCGGRPSDRSRLACWFASLARSLLPLTRSLAAATAACSSSLALRGCSLLLLFRLIFMQWGREGVSRPRGRRRR